jgi:hypothetical protein
MFTPWNPKAISLGHRLFNWGGAYSTGVAAGKGLEGFRISYDSRNSLVDNTTTK